MTASNGNFWVEAASPLPTRPKASGSDYFDLTPDEDQQMIVDMTGLPIANAASFLTELDVPGRDLPWKLRTAALAADHAAYQYTATFKPKPQNGAREKLGAIAFAGAGAPADAALAQVHT